MPRLKQLSGRDLISIFIQFGFTIEAQRGSHVKLRRVRNEQRQTLIIPAHNRIDASTLRAIFRQAQRYVSEQDLRSHFYAD
jgi:predicted RNA binding protein YcfA (HicA-like mRNA interferase family)